MKQIIKEKLISVAGINKNNSSYVIIAKSLNSFRMNLKYADSELYNSLSNENLLSDNTDIFNPNWIKNINKHKNITIKIKCEFESLFIC